MAGFIYGDIAYRRPSFDRAIKYRGTQQSTIIKYHQFLTNVLDLGANVFVFSLDINFEVDLLLQTSLWGGSGHASDLGLLFNYANVNKNYFFFEIKIILSDLYYGAYQIVEQRQMTFKNTLQI